MSPAAAAPCPPRAAFRRPRDPSLPTSHLFLANVEAVGDGALAAAVASAAQLPSSEGVDLQRPLANRSVAFASLGCRESAARAAEVLREGCRAQMAALGLPAGVRLKVGFAEAVALPPPPPPALCEVALNDKALGVPGVHLIQGAVSEEEEENILAALYGSGDRQQQQQQQQRGEQQRQVEEQAVRVQQLQQQRRRQQQANAQAGGGEEVGAGGGPGGGGPGGGAGGQSDGASGGGAAGWQTLARRRVKHFGHRFDYSTRAVGEGESPPPLPLFLARLASRFASLPACAEALADEGVTSGFDQVTANEYQPGAGIAPHVDTHSSFHAPVLSLSLGSDAVMEFRRPRGEGGGDCDAGDGGEVGGGGELGAVRRVLLRRRSLLVMAGEGRYAWHHYIPHRKADLVGEELRPRGTRVSLTMRAVRRGRMCRCPWPDMCDSRAQGPNTPSGGGGGGGACAARAVTTGATQRSGPRSYGPAASGEAAATAAADAHADADGPYGADASNLTASERRALRKAARKRGNAARRAEERRQREEAERAAAEANARMAEATLSGADDAGLPSMPADDGAACAQAASAAPPPIELTNVRAVYDAIAGHFSATRYVRWPQVASFLQTLPPHALVADVGAGNGKYLGGGRAYTAIGVDSSVALCAIAARKGHEAAVGDALAVPLRSGAFDAALSIAVLHHLSTTARRAAAIREMGRLLRPGGTALVTVWASKQSGEDLAAASRKWKALEADAQAAEGRDVLVPWHLPFHRPEARGALAAAAQGAAVSYVRADKDAVVFDRYYHAFDEGELEGVIAAAKCGLRVERAFYDKGNWCAVLRMEEH